MAAPARKIGPGDNSARASMALDFNEDKPSRPPRVRDKDQERRWALYMRNAAMLLKTHFRSLEVSIADLRATRRGDDALVLRKIYLAFLRERIPTWFLAESLDMDRGTPTKDQLSVEEWMGRDEELDLALELLFDGMDKILQTSAGFIHDGALEQLAIDRDIIRAERALKSAREAIDKLEVKKPPPLAWAASDRARYMLQRGDNIVDVSRETGMAYKALAEIQTSLEY